MNLRIVLTAPWRRAPLLGLRQPGVVAALLGATVILGIAAASGPLFLSSAGSAAVDRFTADFCPEQLEPALASRDNPFDYSDAATRRADDATVRAAFREQGLPAPYRILTADVVARLGAGGRRAPLMLYSRADMLDHVRVRESADGEGLWFSDLELQRRGLRVGDQVSVAGARAPIVGSYQDLNGPGFGADVPRYWCSWSSAILVTLESRPPPFVLADEATVARLAAAVPSGRPDVAWYSPVALDDLSVSRAEEIIAATDGLPTPTRFGLKGPSVPKVGAGLAEPLAVAERTRDGLRGPVIPVAVAGTLVALALLGGAGTYWAERRAAEVRLLSARGAGPPLLAVKAMLEMVLPVAAGVVLGWVAAIRLVGELGPSARLDAGAQVTALLATAGAAVLGLLLVGVVAAMRSRGGTPSRPLSHRWWVRTPWELLLLTAAYLVYRKVDESGGLSIDEQVVDVDPTLIMFPLLALGGGLLLATRIVGAAVPALRRLGQRLPPAGYLATRRLTGSLQITLAVLVLAAIPLGVLVYSAVVTRSASDGVRLKADLYVGADNALVAHVPPGERIDTGGHGTQVSVITGVQTEAGDAVVLGVDPDTFARFASYDAGVVGGSVPDLVPQLARSADPVPAIVAACDGCRIETLGIRSTELPVDAVASVKYFPGMRMQHEPTIVLNRAALADVDTFAQRIEEIWTTDAELGALRTTLGDADVSIERQRQPEGFLDVTDLVPLVWSFGYLQALAGLTGLIAVAALLLYVAARQRRRVSSYVLALRMGVRRGTHLRSLTYELAGLLGLAWLLGVTLGWVSVRMVYSLLNLNPDYPPDALLRPHTELLVGTTVGVAVIVVLGAWLAQRTADRVRPAEIMRLAE